MNLTPEQLEQCRKEFEAWVLSKDDAYVCSVPFIKERNGEYTNDLTAWMFDAYKAAWRPIPSVDELWDVFMPAVENGGGSLIDGVTAIHRAFGGKE